MHQTLTTSNTEGRETGSKPVVAFVVVPSSESVALAQATKKTPQSPGWCRENPVALLLPRACATDRVSSHGPPWSVSPTASMLSSGRRRHYWAGQGERREPAPRWSTTTELESVEEEGLVHLHS
jgi:hypothetical protein